MTQSLLNNGIEGNNPSDNMHALPKWICAEDFKARPENKSGTPRMELARKKEGGEHILVIYNAELGTFTDRHTCCDYTAGALEIKIVEIR